MNDAHWDKWWARGNNDRYVHTWPGQVRQVSTAKRRKSKIERAIAKRKRGRR